MDIKKTLQNIDSRFSENLYRTKDINIAAYLYSNNATLIGLTKDLNHNFYYFNFREKELCEQLERKFWAHEASVDPLVFADSLRALKQQLFSQS